MQKKSTLREEPLVWCHLGGEKVTQIDTKMSFPWILSLIDFKECLKII